MNYAKAVQPNKHLININNNNNIHTDPDLYTFVRTIYDYGDDDDDKNNRLYIHRPRVQQNDDTLFYNLF